MNSKKIQNKLDFKFDIILYLLICFHSHFYLKYIKYINSNKKSERYEGDSEHSNIISPWISSIFLSCKLIKCTKDNWINEGE